MPVIWAKAGIKHQFWKNHPQCRLLVTRCFALDTTFDLHMQVSLGHILYCIVCLAIAFVHVVTTGLHKKEVFHPELLSPTLGQATPG